MAIVCDNCNKDVTPQDEEEIHDRRVISLNGGKKCLCTDCFITLSEFACSDEHRKKTKAYLKEFKERE